MAHYLFESMVESRGIPAIAVSMSVLGLNGVPADPHAVSVCQEIGLDLSEHRAQPLNQAMLRAATHVFVMESFHEAEAIRAGAAPERIHYLGAYDPQDSTPSVTDPHRQGREAFVECRERITRALDAFVETLG